MSSPNQIPEIETGDVVNQEDDSPPRRRESSFKSLLRLMRISMVFTAIADILTGFFFVHQAFQPVAGLAMLVVASCCLYTAGMILNDVFDFEVDSRDRPERPLPSGAISLGLARGLGFGLLIAGLVSAAGAWVLARPADVLTIGWEPAWVAAGLIVAILLYNKWLKKTPVAPFLMGSCRFLNILLGMSLAGAEFQAQVPAGLVIAGGFGVYISGVTWFARSEARESDPKMLTFGFVLMMLGLAAIAGLPFYSLELPATVNQQKVWLLPFVIVLFAYSVTRLAVAAIADPIPAKVQMTIRQSLLAIILIHAGICFWIDSNNVQLSLSVLVLLFPAIFLGRWFKAT